MTGTSRTGGEIRDATTASGDPPTNYDVFINHRGPDVKKGFADHLATALQQVGVYSFVDYKDLHRGEDTWPNIVSAIRHSKFHIAIFSPDYASSVWCLKELCEILECRTRESFLPIFYKVQAGHLRHLSSPESIYHEAFAKHDTRNDEEDVRKWKKALYDASMVTGWTLEGVDGFEARLVKRILSKILDVLNPGSLDVAKHPVGVDEKVREVLNGMKIASGDIPTGLQKFGIYGMGGVGKTTLAKSIYNEIYRGFDGSCFIESVRSEAQSPNGLRGVQERILFDLLKAAASINVGTVSNGKQVMRDRCSGLKILLVLDDINEREELDALLTPFESGRVKDGSLVVITTRDEQILQWANVQGQLPLNVLSEAHAHLLFNWHAFLRPKEPPQGFEAVAKEVVDACRGLPLALETLGAHLYGKGMGTWEATVKALQSDRGNLSRAQREVMKVLQISFDELSQEEQEMFLDIACFMLGKHEKHVRRVWSDSDTAELSFETLRLKSLVKVSNDGRLTMHDLLRDMGREIVVYGHDLSRDRGHKEVWERRYLWIPRDVQSVLQRRKAHQGASELRGLRVDRADLEACLEGRSDENGRQRSLLQGLRRFLRISKRHPPPCHGEGYIECNAKCFTGMDSLKFLELGNGVKISGDFSLFSKELKWLEWRECPLRRLPRKLDLRKLAVLDLEGEGSGIETLSNRHKFENLQELRLHNCRNFRELPDFRVSCKRLEVLDLWGCGNLKSVPESIGCLSPTLTHLNLSRCDKLTALPDTLGGLRSLMFFSLSGCYSIRRLPDAIGQLASLEEAIFDQLSYLERLPQSLGNLTKLSSLSLSGCDRLEELPSTIGNLRKLSHLSVSGAGSIEEIPAAILSLTNLVRLDASHCRSLARLPEEIGSLCKLARLDLSNCGNLREVPPLPSSLEELYTDRCGNLREIGLLPDSLLKSWGTYGCPSLMSLPHNLNLKYLDVYDCSSLGTPEVCSQLAALTSVRHLNLRGTGVCLGQWIENLVSLETVALDGESLPELVLQYKPEVNVKVVGKLSYSIEMTMPHTFDGTECKALVFCSASLYYCIGRVITGLRSQFYASQSSWTYPDVENKPLQIGIFRATEHPFVASLKGGTTHSLQIEDDFARTWRGWWHDLFENLEVVPEVVVGLVYEDHELKEVLKQLAGSRRVKNAEVV